MIERLDIKTTQLHAGLYALTGENIQ